jgi:hypothetical protein
MTKPNGCHDRKPFKDYYLPTGAPDIPKYRIPHVFTTNCQVTKTAFGQTDPKCTNCKHKEQK